jgi:hypothetical protein
MGQSSRCSFRCAIQLASCLQLREALEKSIALVAFDDRLATAARKEKARLEYGWGIAVSSRGRSPAVRRLARVA